MSLNPLVIFLLFFCKWNSRETSFGILLAGIQLSRKNENIENLEISLYLIKVNFFEIWIHFSVSRDKQKELIKDNLNWIFRDLSKLLGINDTNLFI